MDTAPKEVSVDRMLRRLSVHMEGLANNVHEIEMLVSKELGNGRVLGVDGISRLQRLDHLRQSLEDASLLVHFASRCCKGTLPANTARKLRLEATRDLLGPQPPQGSEPGRSGEVDLF